MTRDHMKPPEANRVSCEHRVGSDRCSQMTSRAAIQDAIQKVVASVMTNLSDPELDILFRQYGVDVKLTVEPNYRLVLEEKK